MLLSRLLMLSLILVNAFMSQGCHRLINNAESLAVECGIARDQARVSNYLKIIGTHGQGLEAPSLQGVRVLFQDDATYSQQSLGLTPKGCVKLPDMAGQLFISSKVPRAGAQYYHSASLWTMAQPQVKLIESPSVKASLSCDPQGIFANSKIQQPFQFEVQGSLSPVQITIYVFDQKNKSESILFTKARGRDQLGLPLQLDVTSLKEGSYKLRARIEDPGDGFEVGARPLTPDESCDLIVIRGKPLLNTAFNLQDKTKLPVFRPGEQLPWLPENVNDELFVCKEEPGSVTNTESDGSCRPRGVCSDSSRFIKVRSVVVSDPGIFDYYVYSQDQAGNLGPMQCQTLVVSAVPPKIELRWKRHDWNTDGGEVMDLPYATLEAEVRFNHPSLDQNDLQRRLQCKVEFLLHGRDVLKGDRVSCLKGRCQGQSMGDFVPCDSSIAFTIQKAWEQKSIKLSQIRLTARIDDGASHVETKSIGVWINSSKWLMKPAKVAPQTIQPWIRLTDNKGQELFLHPQNNVYKVTGEKWIPTPVNDNDAIRILAMSQNREGEIHGIGFIEQDGSKAIQGAFYWNGQAWERSPQIDSIRDRGICANLYKTNFSDIFCGLTGLHGNDLATLATMKNGRWTIFPLNEIPNLASSFASHQDAKGTLWIYGDGKAHFRRLESKLWEVAPIEPGARLLEDKNGTIWMAVHSEAREFARLHRLKGERFEPEVLPPATQSLRDDFYLSPSGDLTYGAYHWDSVGNSWEPLPQSSELDGIVKDYYPFFDNRGKIWWFDSYGLLGTLNGQAVYLPLNLYGLSCFDEGVPCGITITGSNTLTLSALSIADQVYGTFTFQVSPLSSFDLEGLGMPTTKDIFSFWTNPDQSIEMNFTYFNGPLFGFKDGVWKQTSSLKLPSGSNGYRAPDGAVFYEDGRNVFVSRNESPWSLVYKKPGSDYGVLLGGFKTLGQIGFFKLKDENFVFMERDENLVKIDVKDSKHFFALDSSLWTVEGQSFIQYKDFDFVETSRLSFTDTDVNLDEVYQVMPLANEKIALSASVEGTQKMLILNLKTGKTWELKVPFLEDTQIAKIISLDHDTAIVQTFRGIFAYDIPKGLWRPLIQPKDLSESAGADYVSNLHLDPFKRLWLHRAGIFFRYDLQRPQVSF